MIHLKIKLCDVAAHSIVQEDKIKATRTTRLTEVFPNDPWALIVICPMCAKVLPRASRMTHQQSIYKERD